MFTSIDKALVALLMAAIYLLNQFTPLTIGISEAQMTVLVSIVTPALVWLVPNKTR